MAIATDATGDALDITDMMVDPFGLIPDLHSVIRGLHGDEPTDPTYAFHTHYIDGLEGAVTMEVAFADLRSRKDRLFLHIHGMDRATERLEVVTTVDMALRTVAASGGRASVSFDARPGIAYALLGRTSPQPDASARTLIISCRQRPHDRVPAPAVTTVETGYHPDAIRPVAALAGFHTPLLSNPMSQARTESQFRERAFRHWAGLAHFPKAATDAQWEFAYLLQVLKIFGVLDAPAHGLGFGSSTFDPRILLQAAGSTADAAPAPSRPEPDAAVRGEGDGYLGLIDLPDTALLGHYDFLWSTGLCETLRSTDDIIHLAEDSIRYLKPGGLAVHLLRADLRADETGFAAGPVFTRNTLGRLALAMVAGRNEVAQLNFHADQPDDRPVPYGVIIRKG
jgi:hypothetical protein